MSRLWPAIDLTCHAPLDEAEAEERQGTLLAALDEQTVTAVQELTRGWRFFFSTPDARDRSRALLGRLCPGDEIVAVDVPDEDWARRSQEGLGPIRVGRVRIVPPWLAADSPQSTVSGPPLPDASSPIDIVIQPSMGFGTGHHATTRLCASLLQQVSTAGRAVLDVGTGSGVLALVAHRLGATQVMAVDDDQDALDAARENLELNGVTSGIELRRADFRTLQGFDADVVTANLTGGLLIRGVEVLSAVVRPGGTLILSGITVEEEASVRQVYEARPLRLLSRIEEDGWIGVAYERA